MFIMFCELFIVSFSSHSIMWNGGWQRQLQVAMPKLFLSRWLVIPASNVHPRSTEVDNIETWARTNNLTFNRAKSKYVFIDKKRNRQVVPQPVRDFITNCAHTLYAACVTLPCKPSTSRSSSPNYSTHPVLGGASPTRLTDTESMTYCAVASTAAISLPTFLHSISARQRTGSSSTGFSLMFTLC